MTTDPTDPERGAKLDRWVEDPNTKPEVRYAALREVEAADPPRALALARILLADTGSTEFLRLNAIGVLARSEAPEAQQALAALSPGDQAIAARLRSAAQTSVEVR